jgi:NADP-dependent 3-hydroxy acid dehydrogenase YdfG
MPKSRHAMDLNPFGIRGPSIPEWCKLNLAKCVLREIQIELKSISRFHTLQPEDIADIIHFVVSRPYHVNIADLVVMSTAQASSTIVKKN